jgi:peptidoglycan/xylan/chitin deacetylase (PgdA/CDA1 family)
LKNKTKNIVKNLLGRSLKRRIIREIKANAKCLILTYHRVSEKIPVSFGDYAIWVSAQTLELHLKEIKNYFEILPLHNILNPDVYKNSFFSITFDDGWMDTYKVAYPILKNYRAPASVFIPSGLIGKSKCYWFESLTELAEKSLRENKSCKFVEYFKKNIPSWKKEVISEDSVKELIEEIKKYSGDKIKNLVDQAFRALKVKQKNSQTTLGWDEITEMSDNLISFGPHGYRHYILPRLDSVEKEFEIAKSIAIWRNHKANFIEIFCYPNGDWDDETIKYLKKYGYKAGVTTLVGCNSLYSNSFLLKRLDLHESISNTIGLFWFRVYQAIINDKKKVKAL